MSSNFNELYDRYDGDWKRFFGEVAKFWKERALRDYLDPLVVEPVCQHGAAIKKGNGGRHAKGKPLTARVIRLDDDVWAECQRLGKEHRTINEGLRMKLFEPAATESI